ncbi:MAG: hypothetical protein ACK5IJ_08870 [Mangrovibacterium sp.]
MDISGDLKSNRVNIHYESIQEEEFLIAMKRNVDHIRCFTARLKLNESPAGARVNSALTIGESPNYICLFDLPHNRFHRARNFFLEDRIGDFYIIKRIQFEDDETIFWNSVTGETALYLIGTSVVSRPQDSLVFYSSTFRVTPEDYNPITLMKIHENKIDTLLDVNTNWTAHFSFFDKEHPIIYYIHSYYDENYDIIATYAKMEFKIKGSVSSELLE